MNKRKDVIVACDFPSEAELDNFVGLFKRYEKKPFLKVGMELFYSAGPDVVRRLKGEGFDVFLDLKLHDIPNTVGRAMSVLANLGADMVNLHAAGGSEMMKRAAEGLVRHDGARPLVPPEVITKAILKAAKFGAAAPAIPVKDTIKVSKTGAVDETPDRSTLFAVQTPQVFDYALLLGALQNAKQKGLSLTDDCSAVEALGMTVLLTDGSEENIKITTPLDLDIAELILKRRQTP